MFELIKSGNITHTHSSFSESILAVVIMNDSYRELFQNNSVLLFHLQFILFRNVDCDTVCIHDSIGLTLLKEIREVKKSHTYNDIVEKDYYNENISISYR